MIKIPVFSFSKFPNVNKELGPEMNRAGAPPDWRTSRPVKEFTGTPARFIDYLTSDFFQKVYAERNLYLSR